MMACWMRHATLLAPVILAACGISGRYVEERGASGGSGGAAGAGTTGAVGAAAGMQIVQQPEVALIQAPTEVAGGFGSSLASGHRGPGARLLVGGSPLRSTYDVLNLDFLPGTAEPTLSNTPFQRTNPAQVYLSDSPAALLRDPSGPPEPCFAVGVGDGFVHLDCGELARALPAPEQLAGLLRFSFANAQPTLVSFGSNGDGGQDLLVAASEERFAWYYARLDAAPVALMPALSEQVPSPPERRVLAIVQISNGPRLLLVGIPAQSRVLLFQAKDAGPEYWGCWSGGTGFGKAIAGGKLFSSSYTTALAVAADDGVHVLNGKISNLDPAAPCAPVPPSMATVTCESVGTGGGCAGSDFGAALAIGDLDGDDTDELVVGAPQTSVSGTRGAGAVHVFKLANGTSSSTRTLPSPIELDQLGWSLALPLVADRRRIIAAGAPGNGRVALFY